MGNEYQNLPTNRGDRLITNWDYDEEGRWGQKQYIMCWFLIIFIYGLLFLTIIMFAFLKK